MLGGRVRSRAWSCISAWSCRVALDRRARDQLDRPGGPPVRRGSGSAAAPRSRRPTLAERALHQGEAEACRRKCLTLTRRPKLKSPSVLNILAVLGDCIYARSFGGGNFARGIVTMSPGPNSSVACTSPRITSRMSSLSSTSRHVAELTPSCVADSTRQRRDPVKRNDVLPLGGPLAFAALGAQLGPGRKSEDGSPREPRVITAGALPALAVARRGRRSSCRGQPAWYYRVDVALAFGAAPVGAGGGRSGV